MRSTSSNSSLAILLLAPALAFAHGDDDVRFVSPHGADRGGCETPAVACAGIGYAAGQAGKGGVVRVAAGEYEVATQDDLFHLHADSTDLTGGYGPDFESRDPAVHRTLLIGAPVERRDALEARGFQVITDTKWVGTGKGADPLVLAENVAAMQSSSSFAACTGGSAGGFPCQSVNLHSHLALADFSSLPSRASDVWGFRDLNTEREYALVGLRNGIAVVDVTDPAAPFEVGTVPGAETGWRDLKVLQTWDAAAIRWIAYAYVSADAAEDRLTIVDLTGLPHQVALAGRVTEDLSAHNLNLAGVDPSYGIPLAGEVPVLYLAGSNLDGGAFRAFDLSDPLAPALVARSLAGYMHDGTTITLRDPARTLLADFNEQEVQLWDISAADAPRLLSQFSYATSAYVHSGSWSEDGRHLFIHDELDERDAGLDSTLYVFDVTDPADPAHIGTWTGPSQAIDHNGYARGNRYYMSNYARGLTILDLTDSTTPVTIGHFDSFTVSDATGFTGAWGVYPYLPSRAVLVSDIQGGLFVLEDMTRQSARGRFEFTTPVTAGVEGDTVTLGVARFGGTAAAASVGWEVLPGSAGEQDVALAHGRLDWADGDDDERAFTVALHADAEAGEVLERFFVRLFDPRGGATLGEYAIATVFVAEPGVGATLATADPPVVPPGMGRAFVVVMRHGSAAGEVRLLYETADGSATAGDHYTATAGTLVWPDGDATGRVIEIAVDPERDTASEPFSFTVRLFGATGAAFAGTEVTVRLQAIEMSDEGPSPPAPPALRGGGGTTGYGSLVLLVLLVLFRLRQPTQVRLDPPVGRQR